MATEGEPRFPGLKESEWHDLEAEALLAEGVVRAVGGDETSIDLAEQAYASRVKASEARLEELLSALETFKQLYPDAEVPSDYDDLIRKIQQGGEQNGS